MIIKMQRLVPKEYAWDADEVMKNKIKDDMVRDMAEYIVNNCTINFVSDHGSYQDMNCVLFRMEIDTHELDFPKRKEDEDD